MYVRGKGNGKLDGWLPEFFGGTYPAQTWTEVMTRAMEGVEVEEFPEPVYVDGEAPSEGHAPYVPPPPPTKKPPKDKPSEPTTESPSDEPGKPTKPPKPPETSEPPETTEPTEPTETDCPVLGSCDTEEDPPGGGNGNTQNPRTVAFTTDPWWDYWFIRSWFTRAV